MPSVVQAQEVNLNGVRYKVRGQVQRMLTSMYPPKVVIGDVNQDANPNASVITWTDWSPGISDRPIYIGREGQTLGECAVARSYVGYPGHCTLGPLAFQTAAATASTVGAIGELAGEIYAAFGTAIHLYNNGTDSWGASLDTLLAAATDSITIRLSNVVYQIFAVGASGYAYTSNGTVWTNDTKATQFMCRWDERLWGIDSTGQLWATDTIGSETNLGQLPLPNGSVTKLFTGPDASGNEIIYAATLYGLYAYDAEGEKFVETRARLPRHPNNGRGACTWGDAIYFSAGAGVWEYRPQNGSVRNIGPFYSDEMTAAANGPIRALVPSFRELIALNDASSDLHLLRWDGIGWAQGGVVNPGGAGTGAALVSDAYSSYNGWFALGARVHRMALPTSNTLPSALTGFTFGPSGELILPWLVVGAESVNAIALELEIESDHPSATELIEAWYGLDYSLTDTRLGSDITTTGRTILQFPNSTTPSGTEFRAIRLNFVLRRGATTTSTPDIRSVTFRFRKKLKPKWGWSMTLDLSEEYGGLLPKEAQEALVDAAESNPLVAFGYKESTAGDWATSYVDVVEVKALDSMGEDYRGLVSCTVVEP